jgi:hypothetical protein
MTRTDEIIYGPPFVPYSSIEILAKATRHCQLRQGHSAGQYVPYVSAEDLVVELGFVAFQWSHLGGILSLGVVLS